MKRSEIFQKVADLLNDLPEYGIELEKNMIPAPYCLSEMAFDFQQMAIKAKEIEFISRIVKCKTVTQLETMAETFYDIQDCELENDFGVVVILRTGTKIHFIYDCNDFLTEYVIEM